MEEHELQELLAFATGQGRWSWTGPYMHTYPGGQNDAVHEGCVELERRGLLKRHIAEPGHVCWVEASNEPPNVALSGGPLGDAEANLL